MRGENEEEEDEDEDEHNLLSNPAAVRSDGPAVRLSILARIGRRPDWQFLRRLSS